MTIRLVLRSYGGENRKGRPEFYDKDVTLASFLRAAERAKAWGEQNGVEVDVLFANDGPIPEQRLEVLKAHGPVVQTPRGPIGPQPSYRFALDLPELMSWDDADVVAFNEDDYLFDPEAFVALAQAARDLPQAHYFALGHGRPADLTDPEQRRLHGLPPEWTPAPDHVVDGRTWINIMGVTSTFAARVGTLREDRHIFDLAQKPFRSRWFDHETAMMYQGVVPYAGQRYIKGISEPFHLSPREIARATYLLPFRFQVNKKAREQATPHYLYAPSPPLAAHLETAVMDDSRDWAALAADTNAWARENGLPTRA